MSAGNALQGEAGMLWRTPPATIICHAPPSFKGSMPGMCSWNLVACADIEHCQL